jgi:hypothetical protein
MRMKQTHVFVNRAAIRSINRRRFKLAGGSGGIERVRGVMTVTDGGGVSVENQLQIDCNSVADRNWA